jgi:hypothetical protein
MELACHRTLCATTGTEVFFATPRRSPLIEALSQETALSRHAETAEDLLSDILPPEADTNRAVVPELDPQYPDPEPASEVSAMVLSHAAPQRVCGRRRPRTRPRRDPVGSRCPVRAGAIGG